MSKVKMCLVGIMCGTLITGFLIFTVPYRLGFVESNSMEPTLGAGELILVSLGKNVERGDIIVFTHVLDGYAEPLRMVKRVKAVSGDWISPDGEPLRVGGETSPPPDYATSGEYLRVPDNCYFVTGDNHEESYDSASWGDPWVEAWDVLGVVTRSGWDLKSVM